MSVMHILGGIFIGLVMGRLFSMFTLRKIKGGKITFMLTGVLGAFLSDFFFRVLFKNNLINAFFYKEFSIIAEMVVGALVVCYLMNLFGKKENLVL